MSKMIKKTLILCSLLLLLSFNFQVVLADVADGQYNVTVRLLKAYDDAVSMGGSALKSQAKLYVKNGNGRLRIEFQSLDFMDFTGYLGSLTVAGQSVKVIKNFDVYDDYNHPDTGIDSKMKGKLYPKVLEFPVDLSTNIINCSVYVPVMGEMGAGQQKARIEITYPEALINQQSEVASEQATAELTTIAETTIAATSTEPETKMLETTVPETTATKTTISETTIADKQTTAETIYYNVPVALWNANEDKSSMGDNAIEHNANLVVTGDTMQLYLGAAEMSMMNFKTSLVDLYYDDGTQYARADRYDFSLKIDDFHKLRPRIFVVPLAKKEKFLNVMVDPKVEPMGEEPIKARLKLDFNNAVQIDRSQAKWLTASQTGAAMPDYNDSEVITRADKGVMLQFSGKTFANDFNFYADELHGEALTKTEDKYAEQLPDVIWLNIYDVRALADLEAIPYQVDSAINDLRKVYPPQGDFQLTLPIDVNEQTKAIKLYALEEQAKPLDFVENENGITFSYDKFVPFALVAEKSVTVNEQVAQAVPPKSELSLQAVETIAPINQVSTNRGQVVENPAIIMLALLVILSILGFGIYFTVKYYKVVLAELAYAEELSQDKRDRLNREEHRQ